MPSNLPFNASINASSVESQVRLVKGPKPLINFKFYLDIKSHVTTSKLEQKIKELGGAIELFLVQEINLVVTDKQSVREKGGVRTTSPSNVSPATTTTRQSTSDLNQLTRRQSASRTDAMLARVRLQTDNSCTINILHNAAIWGIPVWSVDKFLRWLDKVSATVLKSNDSTTRKSKSPVHIKHLKAPFIKFEPHSRDARPVCYELPSWPMIDLNCAPGQSPFVLPDEQQPVQMNHSDRYKKKMIRKTRISLRGVKIGEPTSPPPGQSGYCEICRCDYQDMIKHIQTPTHLNFVKDDSNYLTLDSLIATGANVEAFLRLHESSKNVSDNNYAVFNRRSARKTNSKNKMEIKINGDAGLLSTKKVAASVSVINNLQTPRITRSSSACEKVNPPIISSGSLSPALSDTGHHLRSRGQLCLPSNLVGTTAEDDGYPTKASLKEARVKPEPDDSDDEQPLSKHVKKNNMTKVQKSPSPPAKKKTNLKTVTSRNKRPTADDRLIFENRAYYKVEVLSSKLRSSTAPMCKDLSQFRMQTSVVEDNGNSNCHKDESTNDRLVVKFKRVRKSELSVLSNEAENFMFPRKDSLSSDNDECETDEERNTTINTSSQHRADSTEIKSTSEPENSQQNKQELGEFVDEYSQDCSSSVLSSCESVNSTDGKRNKKKRRTHAEVFIQDNENYYKFQTPGSRLRFQGSFLPLMTGTSHSIPTPANNKIHAETVEAHEPDKTEIKQEVDTNDKEKLSEYSASLDRVTFSFERISENDASDHKKFRNSQIEKDFELFYDMHYPKFIPTPLPYESNTPLPPKDPQVCKMIFYQRLKVYDGEKKDNCEPNGSKSNSNASSVVADDVSNSSSRQSIDQKEFGGERRRKQKRFINSERNPRKSPRQHASTLAILSGLLHQRRRKTKSGSGMESDADCISLTTIPEHNENSLVNCTNPNEVAEAPVQNEIKTGSVAPIDLDNLDVCGPDLDEFEPPENDVEIVDFQQDFNLVNILNTYSDSNILEIGMKEKINKDSVLMKLNGANTSLFPLKELRRKNRRKKNRTGWPSKRRVLKGRNEPEVPGADDVDDSDVCESVQDASDTNAVTDNNELKAVSVKNFRNKRIPNNRKYIKNRLRTSDVVRSNSDNDLETVENKENTTQRTTPPGPSSPVHELTQNSQSSDCLGFTADECADVKKKWTEGVENLLNPDHSLTPQIDKKTNIEFQPYVRVQKIDTTIEPLTRQQKNRRFRHSSSASPPSGSLKPKSKRRKTTSAVTPPTTFSPPPSPRKLRKPRGRWYRDR